MTAERFLWTCLVTALVVLWWVERLRRLATRQAMKDLLERAAHALTKRGVPGRKVAHNLVPEKLRKSLKLQDKIKKRGVP